MVGNTSTGDYINMVHSRLIQNCPITPQVVTIANTTFVPDITALKWKTTRKSSKPVVIDYVEIPHHILELKKEVTLEVDVIFANEIGFFVITSRRSSTQTLSTYPVALRIKFLTRLKMSLVFIILVALKLGLY